MSIPTVLVTGGAGYVGSHACLRLKEAGYLPIVYDDFSHGYRWAVRFGPCEEGNILDTERLTHVLSVHKPVAVLHFAAFIAVAESVASPSLYYRNNVSGTLSILDAMKAARVHNIVFSSTAAVYGTPVSSPIPESAHLLPINPYGTTKLTAERLLGDFAVAHGFRAAALRYFNACGADPEARIGEAHEPETHLIPLVLDAAAGRRKPVAVFGDDYPTPDGTCIRDYIHVLDLADAHVKALSHLTSGSGSLMLALNLGTGRGASVREVIDTAKRVTGLPILEVKGPRRAGDPAALVADPTRAKTILGWSATRSALEIQISDAWRWHQVYFGKNMPGVG